MKKFVPFLFSLFALLLQSEAGSTYKWKTRPPHYRYRNYRLVGHAFNTIRGNVAVVSQCALACLKEDKCRSFNFFPRRRICQLNDRSHVTQARHMRTSYGCLYFVREAFSIDKVTNKKHTHKHTQARMYTHARTHARANVHFYYYKYQSVTIIRRALF